MQRFFFRWWCCWLATRRRHGGSTGVSAWSGACVCPLSYRLVSFFRLVLAGTVKRRRVIKPCVKLRRLSSFPITRPTSSPLFAERFAICHCCCCFLLLLLLLQLQLLLITSFACIRHSSITHPFACCSLAAAACLLAPADLYCDFIRSAFDSGSHLSLTTRLRHRQHSPKLCCAWSFLPSTTPGVSRLASAQNLLREEQPGSVWLCIYSWFVLQGSLGSLAPRLTILAFHIIFYALDIPYGSSYRHLLPLT